MDYRTEMMQPMDPLSQLAMCCGLGRYTHRHRDRFKQPRNFYYSPSHAAHLNHQASSWALASHTAYGGPHQPHPGLAVPQQPYLLLSQPVIITTNPATGLSQTNHHTMTLVQHAQTAQNSPATGGAFPYYSLMPAAAASAAQHQPNIVTSQYAIYGSSLQQPASTGSEFITQAMRDAAIQQQQQQQPIYSSPARALVANSRQVAVSGHQPSQRQGQEGGERKVASLSSEIFRQLELIEKQVDISADMDTVEKYGIVITRALDPYSLVPHLKESTLREYNEQYLRDDGYVVRFIEIIKRPGQTLGLYIRDICFEDAQGRGSRAGLVITKIDTDSPVYNSPVLHVGDEILSINLVDVSGMSLDNVVVIMSIPRRLVLALRIPRDRSLDMDLMQQQQFLQQQQMTSAMREPAETMMERQEAVGAFVERPPPPRAQSASLAGDYSRFQIGNPTQPGGAAQVSSYDQSHQHNVSSSDPIKQPIISNIRLGDTPEQSSYFSSSIDAINRELKELRRQRMALSNNEQNLVDSSSSTRVDF